VKLFERFHREFPISYIMISLNAKRKESKETNSIMTQEHSVKSYKIVSMKPQKFNMTRIKLNDKTKPHLNLHGIKPRITPFM
jgi:hypothetical protein